MIKTCSKCKVTKQTSNFKDNPDFLQKAASYINSHKQKLLVIK